MLSPVIAEIARRAGIDIVSIDERHRKGVSDQDLFLLAAAESRCLVTVNHKDFVPMTRRFLAQRLAHAGVLLLPGSVSTNAYAAIASALIRFAEQSPDGLQPYEIRWLSLDLT